MFPVVISGYGETDNCYMTILGTKYMDPVTLELPAGTALEAYSSGIYRGSITVDNKVVSVGKPASYTINVDRALKVQFTADTTMYTSIAIITG